MTSLQGSWAGAYGDSSRKTTKFEADIQQNEGVITGRITELQPGSRGASTSSARVVSELSGVIQRDIVQFKKRYSAEHIVSYSGRVAADYTNVSGTWSMGTASGTWEMHRVIAPSIQQNQPEPDAKLTQAPLDGVSSACR